MSIFIVFGFDTAGTFGEETVDAGRQAPRGVLSSILISGAVGLVFFLAVLLAIPNVQDTIKEGLAGGFPIATIITSSLTAQLIAGITVGEVYLLVILASVFVCTLAIQGAATRMMFSMGRDRHLPLGGVWGERQPPLQDPGQRGDRGRRPRGDPDPGDGPVRRLRPLDRGDGLIYCSYFLCNLGVLIARRKGWPHEGAWFSLGRWGTILVNILALVWGGLMIINIALWKTDTCRRLGHGVVAAAGRDSRRLRDLSIPILASTKVLVTCPAADPAVRADHRGSSSSSAGSTTWSRARPDRTARASRRTPSTGEAVIG